MVSIALSQNTPIHDLLFTIYGLSTLPALPPALPS
jgi:hypothetical protein